MKVLFARGIILFYWVYSGYPKDDRQQKEQKTVSWKLVERERERYISMGLELCPLACSTVFGEKSNKNLKAENQIKTCS